MKDKKPYMLENDPHLKENPFSVPEGYFENLSSRIKEKIGDEQVKPARKSIKWYTLRSQIALAASIIGFALFSYVLVKSILSDRYIDDEYLDLTLLEEMNHIPGDAYLVDLYSLEDDEYTEEVRWEDAAIEYLAINDVEIDLLLEQY